jgi:hypothetical protein
MMQAKREDREEMVLVYANDRIQIFDAGTIE